MKTLKSLRLPSLLRCELEPGGAEGREGDGDSEGSWAGARRVGSVGAEEEEAPLSLGMGRGNWVGGTSYGVFSPPVYLEKKVSRGVVKYA